MERTAIILAASLALLVVFCTLGRCEPPAKPAAQGADGVITVDAAQVMNHISPGMYGSCIEDVNHEIYGGIYAQMIFGESFEEPAAAICPVAGWSRFGGTWTADSAGLHVGADAGAKLVRDSPVVGDGEVAVDVRIDDPSGDHSDNAGLILRVRNPRTGADSWTGYEISLSVRNQTVVLGRHEDNWQPLATSPAVITAGRWYRLRVTMAGPHLRVFLGDGAAPVLDYTDPGALLSAGGVGVRTWQSNASFRHLHISTGTAGGDLLDDFVSAASAPGDRAVSGMCDPIVTGTAQGRFRLDRERPYNSLQSQSIELDSGSGTVGVANRGLNRWGLTFRKGRRYEGRLYLRSATPGARVIVALQSADGAKTYATQTLGPIGGDWKRFDISLVANATDTNARFAIWLDRPGKVWVDQVYLAGTGDALFHSLPIRADIGNMLQSQGLKLLRYGGSMVNAPGYRWKKMVGDPDLRPQYAGTWYPYSTNGFGIEEFVRFCRVAGFEPVVAINIDETDQDAADMIEYLNGPVSSAWGRQRAKNGHPEPYNVRYFEIGNEEGLGRTPAEYRAHYVHYLARFQALHAAMTAKDARLQLIVAAWWRPDEPMIRRIVEEVSGKAALWDVHVDADNLHDAETVDRNFTQMQELFQAWAPGTTLKACLLEENGGRHDLQRALSHAHILNITERLGDFVLMDCPANCLQPWRQNDNGWDQGQIFFTSGQVWGMPPFYAQQMAAQNYQPLRIAGEFRSRGEGLDRDMDVTATRSEDGKTIVLKVVNVGTRSHRASMQIAHADPVAARADIWTLRGDPLTDRNTPEAPERVRSTQTTFDGASNTFDYDFPGHSYTILRLSGQAVVPAPTTPATGNE